MKKILFLFVVLIVALAAVKISQDYSFVEKLTFWSSKKTAILHDQTFSLTVAATDKEKQIGLSKKESLEKNEGMLFLFDSPQYYSFWMKEMEFALDILWIRDGVVVDITRNIPVPGQDVSLSELKRYSADEPFDMVLELNAGYADAHNIEEGDAVNVILQSSQEAILI